MCLNVFYKEKTAFPDYKDNKLKKWKLWDFAKGLVHGFG